MNFDINFFIKLIIVLNIASTLSANLKPAAQSLKASVQPIKTKPKTYLQFYPNLVSSIIFLFTIIALFDIGKIDFNNQVFDYFRIVFVILYVLMSWLQIWSFKSLKEFYSQDMIIFRNQKIINNGPYKFLRHPIYFAEIFQDLFVALALQNIIILILTLFVELPLLILRTNYEEKLLLKELPVEYKEYSKKTSKWFPFI